MSNELTNVTQDWADAATAYAKAEPLEGGNFLSTKGGVLTFNEQAMPGNQAVVVVVDSVRENTYYPAKFDPDLPMPPTCFAFGRNKDLMAPHPSMASRLDYFQPQHQECAGCPMNEWGSADTGRGKACQNRRRLSLLPAGYYSPKKGSRDFDLDLFTDETAFQTGDVAYLRLPVTSVAEWSKYVNQVAASLQRPPYGVVTRVYVEPDPKSQYKVRFEMIEQVSDDLARIVMARHATEEAMPFQGYAAPEANATKGGDMGGFRRPGA